jgi:hypothetical protein
MPEIKADSLFFAVFSLETDFAGHCEAFFAARARN